MTRRRVREPDHLCVRLARTRFSRRRYPLRRRAGTPARDCLRLLPLYNDNRRSSAKVGEPRVPRRLRASDQRRSRFELAHQREYPSKHPLSLARMRAPVKLIRGNDYLLQISIRLPVAEYSPAELAARPGTPAFAAVVGDSDRCETWELWNTLRGLCGYSPRLTLSAFPFFCASFQPQQNGLLFEADSLFLPVSPRFLHVRAVNKSARPFEPPAEPAQSRSMARRAGPTHLFAVHVLYPQRQSLPCLVQEYAGLPQGYLSRASPIPRLCLSR